MLLENLNKVYFLYTTYRNKISILETQKPLINKCEGLNNDDNRKYIHYFYDVYIW